MNEQRYLLYLTKKKKVLSDTISQLTTKIIQIFHYIPQIPFISNKIIFFKFSSLFYCNTPYFIITEFVLLFAHVLVLDKHRYIVITLDK